MPRKALVLDANILIRAVLGQRVRRILEFHADDISFFIPETAYAEAEEHLAPLVVKRAGEREKALRLRQAGDPLRADPTAERARSAFPAPNRTGRKGQNVIE